MPRIPKHPFQAAYIKTLFKYPSIKAETDKSSYVLKLILKRLGRGTPHTKGHHLRRSEASQLVGHVQIHVSAA